MTFNSPVWLYVIPAALLVLWALFHLAKRARQRQLGKFAADRLLAGLLRSYSPARRRFKQLLIAAGVTCILVALARPQYGYTWRETPARGIDVLFALDASKSMLAQDIRPNRLDRAKLAILDFVDKIPGDRVGLVAFAGDAFLQCPLTLDYDAFRLSLEAVDTNVIAHGGTDIARALSTAEKAFSTTNNHKVVVLITDGEDLEESGVQRARQLASQGMTVYTVGVGTPDGALIPVQDRSGRIEYLRDSDGKPVTTRLDESTLKEIADVTGGFYVPLGASGYGLEQVYEAGLKSIPEQELGSRRQKVGLERFQWPLGLGIFLLAWEPLVGTRRLFLRQRTKAKFQHTSKAASVLALLFAMTAFALPSRVHAQSAPSQSGQPAPTQVLPPAQIPTTAPAEEASPPAVVPPNANPAKLYQSGNYAAAEQVYAKSLADNPADAQSSYNLGNSLYAQGKYEAAHDAYQQALGALDLKLQADAFYNLGNASYQLGKAALAQTASPEQVKQGNATATQQFQSALTTGNDILKRADANRVPASLRNEQSQQNMVPQQEIQQAIQQAEQAKQAVTDAQESSESAVTAGETSATFWQQAADEYKSSLELVPGSQDANHNEQVVSRKLKQQQADNDEFTESGEQLGENAKVLEMLIEDLKKLLEQQDQQNDQNQQNQDQNQQNQDQNQDQSQSQDQQNDQQNQDQQQQQNDQPSNSDSSQQQNQDQSQQGQQDQQDQGDNQQSDQQQNQSGDQSQDQKSGEQEQSDEQDSQQQDEDSSGENDKGQQNQPEQNSGEEPGQQPEGASDQQGQQDEPANAEQSDNQQQDQPGSGSEGLSQEQLQELSDQLTQEQAGEENQQGDQPAAAAGGEATEETPDMRRVPGVMTREEARRLLDALKKDDKKLPSFYAPQQYNVDDEGKRKDW